MLVKSYTGPESEIIIAIKWKTKKNTTLSQLFKNHSIKISQLADDTTLFCTSKEEIYLAFNEIETFGSFSGLLMNKNKTGGIWVRKLKHSKDKIEGIKWSEKPIKTLGVYFGNNKEEWTIKLGK